MCRIKLNHDELLTYPNKFDQVSKAAGNGGFGVSTPQMYDRLSSEHPIDLTRYQVANCYLGRIGLINSGGASGADDFEDAARTAVINERAGGTGLTGRKAFQRPMAEG